MSGAPNLTLGETGQIYVTLAAATTFARAASLPPEEARRRLTELLLEARRVRPEEASPEHWRYRSRPATLDIDASISREGPLAVVVHVHVRPYRSREAGDERRRRKLGEE